MLKISVIILGLLALVHDAELLSRRVIETGRDREIEDLFSDVESDPELGCSVPDIVVRYNVIRPQVACSGGRTLALELRYPSQAPDAVASTPSFEVFVLARERLDPDQADALARAVATHVARRDDGAFWRATAASSAKLFRWNSALLAILGSFVGFCLLGLGLGTWFLLHRPWRKPVHRLALAEMGLLALGAFLVRCWLVTPGPTNLYVRMVDPRTLPAFFPVMGAGHAGWTLGWFGVFGIDDGIAFVAGAAAGALTVLPVYLLGWLGGGRRSYGLVSAALIALWPIHAFLSPSDDATGLATMLTMWSLALVCCAERGGRPGLFVILAWLAAGLAAQARVEYALLFPLVGGLVLAGRGTRKAQLRPLALIVTAALMGLTILGIVMPVSALWNSWGPGEALSLHTLSRLAGQDHGSILVPPRTHVVLTVAFLAGLVPAIRATRFRVAAWLLGGVAVAMTGGAMHISSMVPSRYQMLILPAAALIAGVGAVRLGSLARTAWPRMGRPLAWAIVAVPLATAAWGITHPPPRSTFQLEYDFFRKSILEMPPGCDLVEAQWYTDRGLKTPTFLTGMLDLNLSWVGTSEIGDVDGGCFIYWRAASCQTLMVEPMDEHETIPASCSAVEDAYRLEPVLTAVLPVRPGFSARYTSDTVTVGFYRLRSP